MNGLVPRWPESPGPTQYLVDRALVLARRMERRKGTQVPANDIVSAVYSASNRSCGEWGAYECPECGQACLGTEAAYRCCSEVDAGVEDFEMAPA